jgi:hypothetical protein
MARGENNCFLREPRGLRGGGNGWYALGGRGLVGSEDRSYRTPLVRSLHVHGHHYWPLYYGDGPLEGQSANATWLRCATIFRTYTGTKFSTRTKYKNGLNLAF